MSIRTMGRRTAVSFLIVVFLTGAAATAGAEELKVGDKAPDFSAKDVDGKQVKFSSYRGKQVVLTFNRASW